MNLLSIETSCDETAIAIINFEISANSQKEFSGVTNFNLLSNNLISQINLHREFGGVFPSLAKREHAKNITALFEKSLKDANLYFEKNDKIISEIEKEKLNQIKSLLEREAEMHEEILKLFLKIEKPNLEAIAVTAGPGLAPALWVGINFAKAISIFWNIKVYAINHMEGHIVSALIKKESDAEYKIQNILNQKNLSLLISGGHTEIIYFENFNNYKKIGQTLDDAIGEAFDKAARMLDLPYPGGPEISRLAEIARKERNPHSLRESPPTEGSKTQNTKSLLPRPMLHSDDFNFSFSGIKTSVLYMIKKINNKNQNEILENSNELKTDEFTKSLIALEFENAVTEILIAKVKKAVQKYNIENLIIGGGVSANNFIRKNFEILCENEKVKLYLPEKFLTGDNAFMIAAAGMMHIINQKSPAKLEEISAKSNWSLEEI